MKKNGDKKTACLSEIRLETINESNISNVLELGVSEEQVNYIETIPQCLREAESLSLWRPTGIYDGDLPVGFAMYGEFKEEGEHGRVWLDRFLIDRRYQGRGYGTEALEKLLARLFCEYSCDEIYLSLYEENKGAERLYQKHGFAYNGERDEHGEKIMVLKKERWEMRMSEQKNGGEDWELSEDYYKGSEDRDLKLEDFITEESQPSENRNKDDGLLARTAEDVRTVLSMASQGLTIAEISERTGFEEQYVYNIQVCAQGFREDDEIAVAHLVLG